MAKHPGKLTRKRRKDLACEILEHGGSQLELRETDKRLAKERGLHYSAVWSWVLQEAEERADAMLSEESVRHALENEDARRSLTEAFARDGTLVLENRLHEMLRTIAVEPAQIRRLFDELPEDGSHDGYFSMLVFREECPEDLLFDLLREERCLGELQHRVGPRELLEEIVNRDPSDEAIAHLVLYHYSSEDVPLETLVAFVRRHKDCLLMLSLLKESTDIPEGRRQAALAALAAAEKDIGLGR